MYFKKKEKEKKSIFVVGGVLVIHNITNLHSSPPKIELQPPPTPFVRRSKKNIYKKNPLFPHSSPASTPYGEVAPYPQTPTPPPKIYIYISIISMLQIWIYTYIFIQCDSQKEKKWGFFLPHIIFS